MLMGSLVATFSAPAAATAAVRVGGTASAPKSDGSRAPVAVLTRRRKRDFRRREATATTALRPFVKVVMCSLCPLRRQLFR